MPIDPLTGFQGFEVEDDGNECREEENPPTEEELKAMQVFHREFPLERFLEDNKFCLQPLHSIYETFIQGDTVLIEGVRYVHAVSINTGEITKRSVYRLLKMFPLESQFQSLCPMHKKECKLVKESYGFVLFLRCYEDPDCVSETAEEDDTANTHASVEDEADEGFEKLDCQKEKAEIELHGASTEEPPSFHQHMELENELPLTVYPTFSFEDGSEFILLNDIMKTFNLREDYCWAALSNYSEADADFIANNSSKHHEIDTCIETNHLSIMRDLFNEALDYEQQLPTEEEFQYLQVKRGLWEMGRAPLPTKSDVQESTKLELFQSRLLEDDENQSVFVYDDEYLRRHGGTRKKGATTRRYDAAMCHYIRKIDNTKIIIYHKVYSSDASFPIFALKAITKFAGGEPLSSALEKVVLVEKFFALRVFGQGPYCPILRAPYFLTYTAYALALGITDPSQLPEYGKMKLLRGARATTENMELYSEILAEGTELPPPPPPQITEVIEERPLKKPKTISSQP